MKRPKAAKQQASPIRMPKGNSNTNLRKSSHKFSLKRNKGNKKFKNSRRNHKFSTKLFIIPVVVLLFGGLVFISIKYVLSLRHNAFGDKTYAVNDVVGLTDVPEYPGSQFTFIGDENETTVKEFLAAGSSAYDLPNNTSVDDVQNYYKDALPSKGWELVNTVALGTEDKEYGQYWVKDNKGLRIYTKYKDVWYETITADQARTALADRVQEEIEREMLMASSEKQDLLPDYPWKIQIPKEYLIKYAATDFKDFRAVSFQKIGTNDIVSLYPVGYSGSKELDYLLEDYCKAISDENSTWKVQNTVPISFGSQSALRGTITSGSEVRYVDVFTNTFNNVVYVLSTDKENDPLFGYIFENIKPLETKN